MPHPHRAAYRQPGWRHRRSRHAPLRSITRTPCSSHSGAHWREFSCGSARNTISVPASRISSQLNATISGCRLPSPSASCGWTCSSGTLSRRRLVSNAPKKQRLRLGQPRVRQQQARQLPARISAHAGHSCAHRRPGCLIRDRDCSSSSVLNLASQSTDFFNRFRATQPSPHGPVNQPINSSMRPFSRRAWCSSGQTIKTVSSPAMVPTTSGQSS